MMLNSRNASVLILGVLLTAPVMAKDRQFITSDRLTLGTDVFRSASVRLGDIDRDGDLDVVVANGRHWP